MNRIILTLKDNCVINFDRMPSSLTQKTKEYLEKLKQGKPGHYTTAHFKPFGANQHNITALSLVVNLWSYIFDSTTGYIAM